MSVTSEQNSMIDEDIRLISIDIDKICSEIREMKKIREFESDSSRKEEINSKISSLVDEKISLENERNELGCSYMRERDEDDYYHDDRDDY